MYVTYQMKKWFCSQKNIFHFSINSDEGWYSFIFIENWNFPLIRAPRKLKLKMRIIWEEE